MSDQDLTPDLDDTEGHAKVSINDEAEDDAEGHAMHHGRDDDAEDDVEGHLKKG